MARRLTVASLSFVILAGACGQVPAQSAPRPDFPALTGRVVDQADLLTPAQERALSRQSETLEREVGPQYLVVTVPDLQGYAIETYGVQLGRHWGIGDEVRDDGVLLIVAPNERKVRIEVGYGLENRVTDPFAAKVLREHVLPRFEEGRFPQGIIEGSNAITARLRSKDSDAEIKKQDRIAL